MALPNPWRGPWPPPRTTMSDQSSSGDIERASRAAWQIHLGREVGDGLLAGLNAGTLAAAFHETATARPAAPAISIEGTSLTHGELDSRAARAAGWFRARGLRPGDRVLLCAPNSIALVVAYMATLRVGATAVPVGPMLTQPELAAIVAEAKPFVALADGSALAQLQVISAASREVWKVVGLSSKEWQRAETLESQWSPIGPGGVPGDSTAMLAFTSGTTGSPKAALLSHANLLSSIRGAMLAWRWSSDDVLVHALPLTHQHGLGGLHATLLSGSRAIIHSRFDAFRTAATIATTRATVFFGVPSTYQRLIAHEGISREAFTSLRLAISGSAPMSPALFEQVAGLIGKQPLERYGTTESGLDTSNPHDGPRVPGSVGLPLPGVFLGIMSPDGTPLKPGSTGEIVFRGPQVFSGYLDQSDSASAFYPGGWFRTGDVGEIHPGSGYLTITGREKEVIITGGLNVFPREIESILEAHPDVQAAAVIGVVSEHWGEEVTAFVVPSRDHTPIPEDLIAYARERLAPYKRPKRIIVMKSLPLAETGKIDRRQLRAIASR